MREIIELSSLWGAAPVDDLITYLMNRSPAMRAALEGKAALVMDPSRLRSNEPLPPCPPLLPPFPNTIPNFYPPIKATRTTKRQRARYRRPMITNQPRRLPNHLWIKIAFRALPSNSCPFFALFSLSSPIFCSLTASRQWRGPKIAEQSGDWPTARSVQSLAKVFEVVAGIQVGTRRNSRGRIPPCLTRKYFSGGFVFSLVGWISKEIVVESFSSNSLPLLVASSTCPAHLVVTRLRSRFRIILNIVIDWRHVCTILYAYVKGGERGWNKTYATLTLSEGGINDDFNQPM